MTVAAPELPAGVTMAADTIAGNVNEVVAVFEAGADAPVAAKLIPLAGQNVQNKAITGGFAQTLDLIYGPPNATVYYRQSVERMAVAVTEELPFKISIVEPKVPLVQSGSMNLKVVAERKEGFKAPITLRMLWNPPGVGSQNEVVIPEGQTEALYPVNANGDAAIRAWKIAILALSDAGKGAVWTSSQLATLNVSAPFLTMQIPMAAGEQGKPAGVLCKIQQLQPFDGEAQVQLTGLPPKVTIEKNPLPITKASADVTFNAALAADAPVGQHKSLFCQVTVMKDGEPDVIITSAVAACCALTSRLRRSRTLPHPRQPSRRLRPLHPRPRQPLQPRRRRHFPVSKSCASKPAKPALRRSSSARLRRIMNMNPRILSLLFAMLAVAAPAFAERTLAKVEVFPGLRGAAPRARPPEPCRAGDLQRRRHPRHQAKGKIYFPIRWKETEKPFPAAEEGKKNFLEKASTPGEGRQGRTPDQLQARRDAGLHARRLQHRQLPRRGARQGRLPPFALRLRPRRRLLPPHARDGRPPHQPRAAGRAPRCSKSRRQVPHTGGERFKKGDPEYETLVRWLEAGAPSDPPEVIKPVSMEILPKQAVLEGEGATQRMTVRAKYSDGTDRDVTNLAVFLTNNDNSAKIDRNGASPPAKRGEAFVMARFATFTVGSQVIVIPKGVHFAWPNVAGEQLHRHARLRQAQEAAHHALGAVQR